MGFGVVSLSLGNPPLPLADGLVADAQLLCQLQLGHMAALAQGAYQPAGLFLIHGDHLAQSIPYRRAWRNERAVEALVSGRNSSAPWDSPAREGHAPSPGQCT